MNRALVHATTFMDHDRVDEATNAATIPQATMAWGAWPDGKA